MGTDALVDLLKIAHEYVMNLALDGGPYRPIFAIPAPSIGKLMMNASHIGSVAGFDAVRQLLGNFDQVALDAFDVAAENKANWSPFPLSKFALARGALFGGRGRTIAWYLFWYPRDPQWAKNNI